jgi:hypothetical protein
VTCHLLSLKHGQKNTISCGGCCGPVIGVGVGE